MRCKPGISAFVIVSRCGNEGRVVEVNEFVEKGVSLQNGMRSSRSGWLCFGNLLLKTGQPTSFCVYPDHHLLPINGGETPNKA